MNVEEIKFRYHFFEIPEVPRVVLVAHLKPLNRYSSVHDFLAPGIEFPLTRTSYGDAEFLRIKKFGEREHLIFCTADNVGIRIKESLDHIFLTDYIGLVSKRLDLL